MKTHPSAGIIAYRIKANGEPEFLLCYPGGPYYNRSDGTKKDDWGRWGIPKGKIESGEYAVMAAIREFQEETGWQLHIDKHLDEILVELTPIKYSSGKTVYAWGIPLDIQDISRLKSNFHEMEYPDGSGTIVKYPEVVDYCYMGIGEATKKCHRTQLKLLIELTDIIKRDKLK